jgi:hypothetical protein
VAATPASAHIVIIADTCYAAACATAFKGRPGSQGRGRGHAPAGAVAS